MFTSGKLKPNEKAFSLIVIILGVLMLIIYANKNISKEAAIGIWGLAVFLNAPISLGEYLKTRNFGFMWAFLFQITAALFAVLVLFKGFDMNHWLFGSLVLSLLVFGILGIYANFSKKTKWRYREVLELAARPVSEVSDGFTNRPKPIGQVVGTESEIKSFGQFLLKNLIVIPYYEADRAVFSLAMTLGHRLGWRSDHAEFSFVIFQYDGHVSAVISKNDYLKYKDQYAFDQLCESLGNLLVQFFDLYKNGAAVRIIDSLNSLGLSPLADFRESTL